MANRLAHALARAGREPRRPPRVVRTELARGRSRRSTPAARSASRRCRCRTGSTRREMQYVIDNSDATVVRRRRRAGAAGRVGARPAPEGAGRPRVRRRRARRVARAGTTSSPRQSDAPPADVDPNAGAAGATMIYTSGTTGKPKGAMRTDTDAGAIGALLDRLDLLAAGRRCTSPPARCTTRARSRSRCSRTRSAAPSSCSASSIPSAWLRLVQGAPGHRHVQCTDPAQAHRRPARRASWPGPTSRRCAP